MPLHVHAGLGELKQLAMELNIVIEDAVLEGIIALADHDGGGDISYAEFARVLTADDVMSMAPLSIAPAEVQRSKGVGRNKMSDMPGAQGLSWTTGG